MSAEGNMALARRFMEERINGNLDTVDAMLAPQRIAMTLTRMHATDTPLVVATP